MELQSGSCSLGLQEWELRSGVLSKSDISLHFVWFHREFLGKLMSGKTPQSLQIMDLSFTPIFHTNFHPNWTKIGKVSNLVGLSRPKLAKFAF